MHITHKTYKEDNLNKKIYALFILIICFVCIFALASCKDKNIVIDPEKIPEGVSIEYIDATKFSFDSNTHTTLTIDYLANKDLIFAIQDFKYKVQYQDGTSGDISASDISLSIKDGNGAEVSGPYLPGSYTLTFKYGDFEKVLNLVVNPINISENVVTYRGIKSKYAYTGSKITPIPTLYCGETQLVKDVDYTLAYTDNIEKGNALIHVIGMGIYTGEKQIPFEISTLYVEGLNFEDLILPYNGQDRRANVELDLDANPIEGVKDITYTYTYTDRVDPVTNLINVGDYKVVIDVDTEIGYVEVDPITIYVHVTTLSIENCVMQDFSATYKGSPYSYTDFISYLVKDEGGRDLVYNRDYELLMGAGPGVDNKNASTDTTFAALIMSGLGNYSGNKAIEFKIERESLNHQSVAIDFDDLTNDFIYTGLEITRSFTKIEDQLIGYTLNADDYTVSYENNINAGTASLIITGKGNFKDSYVYEYDIEKQLIDITSFNPNLEYTTYNALDRKVDYYLTGADERFAYLDVEYAYSINEVATNDVKNVGDYTVDMTISVDSEHSNNYYISVTQKSAILSIIKAQANASAIISATGYDYTGSKILPTINVRWNGDALPYREYQVITSLTYHGDAVDSIDVGKYYVKLLSDNYSFDESEFEFRINQVALPSTAVVEWPTIYRDVWQYNYKAHTPQGGSISVGGEAIDVNYSLNYIVDDYSNVLGVEINAVMKNYETVKIQVYNGDELINVVNSLGIVMRQNGIALTAVQMDSLSNLSMGDKIEIDVPQGYEIVYSAEGPSVTYTNTVIGGNTLTEVLGGARVDGNLCYEDEFRLYLNDSNSDPIATSKTVDIGRAIFDHYEIYASVLDIDPTTNVLSRDTYEVEVEEGNVIKLGLDSSYSYTVSYHFVKLDDSLTEETEKETATAIITSSEVKKVVITIYNSNNEEIVQIIHSVIAVI